MNINRDNINYLLKFALIVGITFCTINSASVNAQSEDKLNNTNSETPRTPNNPDVNQESAEENPEEIEKINNNNSQKDSTSSQEKSPVPNSKNKIIGQQNIFTIKNILLLFTIIDLPIFSLLLALWFLNSKHKKQETREITNKQNLIIKKLDRLNETSSKLNNLDLIKREIISQVQDNNQKITDSKIEILGNLPKNQIHQPVNYHNNTDNHYNFPASTTESAEHQPDVSSYSPVAVVERIPQFIDKYKLDKQSLSNEAKATVVATENSLNKKRSGDESKLVLENTVKNKYWIIQEDNDYYLVPHAKIKIDEYNKETLEALFDCISFTIEYIDFHLIQPAKVSQLDSELWQLEKKGKLEFS